MTTAITSPTSTVSPSWARISARNPATGEGTSESTLSVDTSNSTSSMATGSPTCLNHLVMVPSVTVSPSWGMVTSAISASLSCRSNRSFVSIGRSPSAVALARTACADQPWRLRPVRLNTVSPNSSDRVGWGWMNRETSSTVASQFTAR